MMFKHTAFLLLALATSARSEVPADRALVLSGGERVHVVTLGHGDPVLLVPGLFGSAYGFRKVMPALAASGRQAVVVEPLGIGDSDRPADADYSLTAQADRLAEAMGQLGIDRATVVAHSVGASIALRLAHRHPARVAALVSIEGGPTETAVTAGFRRALRFAPLLRLFGGRRLVRGKIRGQLIARSADPGWVTNEVVDGYTHGAAADLGGTIRAFKRMSEAHEPESLAARLPDVRCPVRLLLGAAPHEGGPNPAEIALLRETLRSFEIERVAGSGHFVFEEAPAAVVDAVARISEEPATAQSTDLEVGR